MIIYTLKEELYLIVYLFSYGVYLFATLDVIDQIIIKLLKKVFLKTIKLILKLIKKIIKLLKPLVYSKEVVDTTKKSAKHYKRILENTFKIKTKNEK